MVEIVSAHTDLRRSGVRYTGLCPFHEERSPSFSVHAEEKLYHCFGCGVGGDLFDFVIAIESVDFPAAVELLADRYGVEVTREQEDPQAEQRRKARIRMTELLERAAGFYSAFLQEAPEAAKARDYLTSRGLGEEILKQFGVGYAPSAWDTLILRGQRAGFKVEELAATGLAQKGRTGGMYDRFRERITFPIRDARGRAVGFGARAMRPEQKPKYLNSAENELFHKSEILYGIDQARPAMAKAGRAVVVEGYTDVLALHQAGLSEAVGIMGTAITEQQIAQLSSTVGTLILALDADAAGQKAMLRAQQVAAGRNLTIRVVAMPAGEDPAEIATAEGGGERFGRLVEEAVDLPEFQVGLILDSVDTGSPQDRDRGLAEAAPVIVSIPPGATREELTRRLADGLQIDPAVVVARLARTEPVETGSAGQAPSRSGSVRSAAVIEDSGHGAGRQVQAADQQPAASSGGAGSLLSSRERRERSLLAMCIARPHEGRQYIERLQPSHLTSPLTVRAVAWLRDNLDSPTQGLDPADRELQSLIAAMVVRADPEQVGEGSIRRNFMELELASLEDEIAVAATGEDAGRRAELNRRRSKLVDQLRRAEAATPGET
jgi:DNA primase